MAVASPRAVLTALPLAAALLRLRTGEATEQAGPEAEPRPDYLRDPVGWIDAHVLWRPGEGLTAYQREIIASLVTKRRVAVRGPHGLGKTALVALVVLWFAETRDRAGIDWKVPTTASAWRQLTKFLWPEIHKWARRLDWAKLGRDPFSTRTELQTLSLKLATGEAFAVASDTPEMIEGAHADSLLYIFDESKAIIPDTFDAAEGAFSGAGADTAVEAFALAVSTPGEPQGRFYDIHRRAAGYEDWWTRHVRLEETVAAGRVSRLWAEQRARQWGEGSAVYQNRVLGEFASSDEDGIIPLAWVEAANARWQEWDDAGRPGAFTACGVDIGLLGDKTIAAMRHGTVIAELRRFPKQDTMATAGRVKGILTAHGGRAVVDVIGIGAGVVDRLREEGVGGQVVAFNAAEASDRTDSSGEIGFANKRAEVWWSLRERLDPGTGDGLALPPDDLLTGDLTAPHWKMQGRGKVLVEPKADIKKRLGRSTDDGDAVVMAFYEPPVTTGVIAHGPARGWMPR